MWVAGTGRLVIWYERCDRSRTFLMSLSQLFDRSSRDGSGLIRSPCNIAFLDEFRVVVSYYNNPSDAAFVVFNTLFPQDHPNNVRRFMLPPKYHGCGAQMHLGRHRSLGAMDGDGHLIVDPNQAILAMTLSPDDRVFLILRTQPLIEHACSIRTDVQIPWDEWGRSAVVMKNPTRFNTSIPFIHGARMLVVHRPYSIPLDHRHIHAFDFSRWGTAALPLSDGIDGGTERRAVFNNWQDCVFKLDDGMFPKGPFGIGDSIMFYVVSLLSYPTEEGILC